MDNNMFYRVFIIGLLLLFKIEVAFAVIDAEQWSKFAKQAEVHENYSAAEGIYLQAIEYHSSNPKQYLRAYARLLGVYAKTEQVNKLLDTILFLETTYPNASFDINDEIKLSDIYIKYGKEVDGYQLKEQLVARGLNPNHTKSYIRVIESLLKHYNEPAQLATYLDKLNGIPVAKLDAQDNYKIALLHLKYGVHEVGIHKLEDVLTQYPESKSSRKSLFVLAKESRVAEDYHKAINYYSRYMRDYPEQIFFVQKAFQGIIDCVISLGYENVVDSLAFPLADLVNGVESPRSIFDASENLFLKGQYELAESTFLLGLSAAKTITDNSTSAYDRSLTRLHLVRAAYPLGKLEIARDENEQAIADMVILMSSVDKVTDTNNYLYSQLLLWSAKISADFEDFAGSRQSLEVFLARFPNHKDTDYARYSLARLVMRRWEVDQLRVSDIENKTELHNQTIQFAEAMGNLDFALEMIDAIKIPELKQEALLWTQYIQ